MLRLLLLTFFTFCYFWLLFLLLVTFVSYFLLVKGVRFVSFRYFFTACNFDKLFFTIEKGQGLYSIHCATGEREPCEKYSNAHVENNNV
jgi:hypothetical protein